MLFWVQEDEPAAGILKDFLLANKAEVKRLNIYEYDEEAAREAICAEEYERGREEGIEALIVDNVESGISEDVILKKLRIRFGLEADRAKNYYEKAC